MTRNTFFISSIILLLNVENGASFPHKAIYWEVAPFIYTENNKTKGIIPDYYGLLKKHCHHSTNVMNFTLNMENEQKLHDLLSNPNITYGGDGTLKGITENDAAWMPLLRMPNPQDKPMERSLLFYSPYIAVIVKREEIVLTYKLWLGIANCRHIFVLATILTVFFAIMVWLSVSTRLLVKFLRRINSALYFEMYC